MARGKKRVHKNKRPEVKAEQPPKPIRVRSPLEKGADVVSLVLLVLSFLLPAIMWSQLPQEIPTHFDLSGQPTQYGGKLNMFLLPALTLAVYLVIVFCQRMGPKVWNIPFHVPEGKREDVYPILYATLTLLKIECVAITFFLNLSTVFSFALPVWASVTVLLLFVTVGMGLYAAWQKSKY